MINEAITQLINYAEKNGIIAKEDRAYAVNRVLEVLALDEYEPCENVPEKEIHEILSVMCDYAVAKGMIEDGVVFRDLFDTKVMGAIMPRPSEVISKFNSLYEKSPKEATDWYYKLSCDSNYIRQDRIRKDKRWKLEAFVRVGYYYSLYDPYHASDPFNGKYYHDWEGMPEDFIPRNHRLRWFGPTGAGVTISYDLIYKRVKKNNRQ